MAWAVFAISAESRRRLGSLLRALLIAQLVISLCMLIFCYNQSLKVMMLLKDVHKVTVLFLYGLVLLQAYCMKLHYTSGIRLVSWLLASPHWLRISQVCRVWVTVGCLLPLNGLTVYAACRGTLAALTKEMTSSLRIGISQYLTEPTWKRLLDTMQVELSCCGVERPGDWHEIPWINMDFLNEESDVVMRLAGADGKILPPVTPYSCCTPRVLAACYHDPLQQTEFRTVWTDGSPLLSASLHTCGCVEAVRDPLAKALLALKWFTLIVLLLQVLIVLLTQLLRTSAQDAVLKGDCGGLGTGYLIGPLKAGERQERNGSGAIETGYRSGESTSLLLLERRKRRRRRRDKTPSYPYLS